MIKWYKTEQINSAKVIYYLCDFDDKLAYRVF